jgi:hypothetical protein
MINNDNIIGKTTIAADFDSFQTSNTAINIKKTIRTYNQLAALHDDR